MLGTIHIWPPWKLSNFQDPSIPLVHLCTKFFHPLKLGRSILNRHPLPLLLQTMEQQPHRASERTKSKQKQNHATSCSNWPRVPFFDLAHKHCNVIIKGWLHCLTPESKRRFLVNNILFDSPWCLVMAQIQFSLIKKMKIGRPELLFLP